MTDFRTIVNVPTSLLKIDMDSNLVLIGSCFTENIGARLSNSKFRTTINPFGILYNPESIAQCISIILKEQKFTINDLVEQDGIWNSLYHHSKYSMANKEEMLTILNANLGTFKNKIIEANYIFITFGTAWVYEYKKTKKVVSNCHKLAANEFNRYRLSVDEIVDNYSLLLQEIEKVNPKVKFIFTVSPVRHMKDGAIENQLSKSTLILAIHSLIEKFRKAHYFPAYEMVMDDLRDYRFYNSDMIHPSEIAVDYIWEKFSESWISESAFAFMNQVEKLNRAIQHRPFQPKAEAHQKFIHKQLQIIEKLKKEYPTIDFSYEISEFNKVLE